MSDARPLVYKRGSHGLSPICTQHRKFLDVLPAFHAHVVPFDIAVSIQESTDLGCPLKEVQRRRG